MSKIEETIKRIKEAETIDLRYGFVDDAHGVIGRESRAIIAIIKFSRIGTEVPFAYEVEECFRIDRDDTMFPSTDEGLMTEDRFIDWYFEMVWKLFDGKVYNVHRFVTDKDE